MRLIALLVVLFALVADVAGAQLTGWPAWSTPRGGPDQNPSRDIGFTAPNPDVAWHSTVELGPDGRHVLVDNDRVFAFGGFSGPGTGAVAALDIVDGHTLWAKSDAGLATQAPAVGAGVVAIPRAAGLLVLSQATGDQLWTKPAGGQVLVDGGRVFVVSTTDAATFAVDAFVAQTGELDWHADVVTGPATEFTPPVPPPVAAGGKLILRGKSGHVTAVHADSGIFAWQYDDPDFTQCGTLLAGNMLAAGGRVFTQEECGRLVALDVASGAPLWGYAAADCALGMAADAQRLYTSHTCFNGRTRGRDPATGSELWSTAVKPEGLSTRVGDRLLHADGRVVDTRRGRL